MRLFNAGLTLKEMFAILVHLSHHWNSEPENFEVSIMLSIDHTYANCSNSGQNVTASFHLFYRISVLIKAEQLNNLPICSSSA